MRKAFENYTLLTGNHGRRGSLWKGVDHLLAVEGNGIVFPFSEQYRRVDYKNIQAISYVLTKRYWFVLFALLIPILLLAGGVVLALSMKKAPVAIALGVISPPFLCMLVLHMIMGKTCVCTLQTAVQNLKLKPLTRIKKARPVMKEIESLCQLHQGPMPIEFADAADASHQDYSISGIKPMWQGSAWVMTAGVTLVLWGVAMASELFVNQMGFLILDMLLGVAAFVFSIVGLVKASKRQLPDGLMAALWSSLVVEVLGGITFYALLVAAQVMEAIQAKNKVVSFDFATNVMFYRLANLSFEQTKSAGWIIVGLGVVLALLGLTLIFFGIRKGAPDPKPSGSSSIPPAL